MTLIINTLNETTFDSISVEGSWHPEAGMTSPNLPELAERIFSNSRYRILSTERLKDCIVIKYEDPTPSAFIFNPLSDVSQTFQDPNMPLAMNKLGNAYDRVESNTVGSLLQITPIVADTRNIHVLWLRGHGTPTSLAFGDGIEDGYLTTENVEKYIDVFNRVNPEKGIIILDSCCKGDVNYLAQKIHRLTGRTVYANEHSPGFKGRSYLIRGEDNQFAILGYVNRKIITTIFRNGKRLRNEAEPARELIRAQGYVFPTKSDANFETNLQYLEAAFKKMPLLRLFISQF